MAVEADVVVVGLGLAGVAAMRSAAEEGLAVIGVERTSDICSRSSDFAYFNTETARSIGIKDVFVPDLVNELMRQMNHRPDARILTRWATHAGEALDWYVEPCEGFKFVANWDEAPIDDDAVFGINGDYYVGAVAPFDEHDPAKDHERVFSATLEFNPMGHAPVLRANYDAAVASGNASAYFDAAAQRLVVEDGRVAGVIFENLADGTHVYAKAAKGVVLATGGYSRNAELMDKYAPWVQEEIGLYVQGYPHTDVNGITTDQGDGLVMGVEAGAKIEPGPHAVMAHSTLGGLGVGAFLQLNANGERYINEDLTIDHFSVAVMNQPKNTIYQIFDANWRDCLPAVQAGIGTYHMVSDDKAQTIDEWTSASGDTVEELAANLGLFQEAAEAMAASIERYNELCAKGVDEDFGKRAERMFPVVQPPFYAIRWSPEEALDGRAAMRLLVTLGGLVTDPDARCLDADDEPIEGLFAVGNVQGGRYAGSYPCTVAGASHSMALTYGYLTGKYLAKA